MDAGDAKQSDGSRWASHATASIIPVAQKCSRIGPCTTFSSVVGRGRAGGGLAETIHILIPIIHWLYVAPAGPEDQLTASTFS